MATAHILPAADQDVEDLADYIGVERGNPHAAREFLTEFYRKCEVYARQPEMGDMRKDLSEGIRSFTFKRNYVVIYRPLDDGIDVLRVFHGVRDYRRLFGGE